MEIVKKIYINTYDELNSKLVFNAAEMRDYLFRGHSQSSYKLVPSLLRDIKSYNTMADVYINELAVLMKFYRECNNAGFAVPDIKTFNNNYLSNIINLSIMISGDIGFYWLDDKSFGLAALAQHYGIHTRMLDWTQDVNVALYFATEACESEDITIWAINGRWFQEFKLCQFEEIELAARAIYSKCNSKIPYEWIVSVLDDSIPLRFCIPHYDVNPHLSAQKGVLSIWQHNLVLGAHVGNCDIFNDECVCKKVLFEKIRDFLDKSPCEEILDKMLVNYFNDVSVKEMIKKISYNVDDTNTVLLYEFIINKDIVKQIKENLDFHGYNIVKIYPGYKSIANYVKKELNLKYM